MSSDEPQRLSIEDLDAVLARARAEQWTELALVAGDFVGRHTAD